MTVIYLVRHGQASFSADDYDQLSEKGVKQAALVSGFLKQKIHSKPIIITGTMLRHQQTAQSSLHAFDITEEDNSAYYQDKRWNEYDHQNILGMLNPQLATPQGVRQYLSDKPEPMEQFKSLYIAAMDKWTQSEHIENYKESFAEFSQRPIAALNQIISDYPNEKVIVFSSGGPISIIASHLLGLPMKEFTKVNWSLVNGGVTKIITRGKENKPALSTFNEHDIFEQNLKEQLITYT
jgi:broad specificity phosphatase PhoE